MNFLKKYFELILFGLIGLGTAALFLGVLALPVFLFVSHHWVYAVIYIVLVDVPLVTLISE